jgi:hypothetical protein
MKCRYCPGTRGVFSGFFLLSVIANFTASDIGGAKGHRRKTEQMPDLPDFIIEPGWHHFGNRRAMP